MRTRADFINAVNLTGLDGEALASLIDRHTCKEFQSPKRREILYSSPPHVVVEYFSMWDATPQGHDYWLKFYLFLEKHCTQQIPSLKGKWGIIKRACKSTDGKVLDTAGTIVEIAGEESSFYLLAHPSPRSIPNVNKISKDAVAILDGYSDLSWKDKAIFG